MKARKMFLITIGITLALCLAVSAHAGLAVDFTSIGMDHWDGSYYSLGWSFKVGSDNIDVDALGFYDDQKNGLTQSHDVGIYDAQGNLLASTTVTPNAVLSSWWRWSSLTSPLVLAAGQTYYIAAVNGSENYTWNPFGFVTAPGINFVQDQYIVSSTLAFPSYSYNGSNGRAWFGPNFNTSTAVPLPASLLLMGPGLAGLAVLRKKFNR